MSNWLKAVLIGAVLIVPSSFAITSYALSSGETCSCSSGDCANSCDCDEC